MGKFAREQGKQITRIHEQLMRRLVEYTWSSNEANPTLPGNVGDLDNTVRRLVTYTPRGVNELLLSILEDSPMPILPQRSERTLQESKEYLERKAAIWLEKWRTLSLKDRANFDYNDIKALLGAHLLCALWDYVIEQKKDNEIRTQEQIAALLGASQLGLRRSIDNFKKLIQKEQEYLR